MREQMEKWVHAWKTLMTDMERQGARIWPLIIGRLLCQSKSQRRKRGWGSGCLRPFAGFCLRGRVASRLAGRCQRERASLFPSAGISAGAWTASSGLILATRKTRATSSGIFASTQEAMATCCCWICELAQTIRPCMPGGMRQASFFCSGKASRHLSTG